MTLDEARELRNVAESEILKVLQEFARKTGIHPESVEVSRLSCSTFGYARPQCLITRVEIHTESL